MLRNRKRLIAILALPLALGLWQGSAFAAKSDGTTDAGGGGVFIKSTWYGWKR